MLYSHQWILPTPSTHLLQFSKSCRCLYPNQAYLPLSPFSLLILIKGVVHRIPAPLWNFCNLCIATVTCLSHVVGGSRGRPCKILQRSHLSLTPPSPPINPQSEKQHPSSSVARPHTSVAQATLLPALSLSMSSRDRAGLVRKEEAVPTSKTAPPDPTTHLLAHPIDRCRPEPP
jgi:hypothetical protein